MKLLEKNIEYFITDDHLHTHENNPVSSVSGDPEHHHDHHHEVTEEEAIFNNELNEIDEHENDHFVNETDEEEAVFNNQLNEIVENEFHENIVSFVEENSTENVQKQSSPNEITEEEAVFNNQLNEIENEPVETNEVVFSFVEEEKILAEAQPDLDEDINEDMFNDEVTEEEAIFNNQLNEIDDDEISDHEIKQDGNDPTVHNGKENGVTERIPSIFDTEMLEDEILIEEDEDQFMVSNSSMEQGNWALKHPM